jgi:uncharacterized protein YyaL (SSP411 family)
MSNRLAGSTSPYLRQHAGNPVDWQLWDDSALAAARAQDKPILLSIGYSACHWCHVMAHESFEDADTAALMNALFVNIKVDREERPDLDKIYQLAHQALTGRGGGWPLTVFLTPDDLMPFYAGTYFPREPRHGMPPFSHVLQQVRNFWDTRRDDLRRQNASLATFFDERSQSSPSEQAPDDAPLRRAVSLITRHFDAVNGGYSGAPKFPHCGELELLFDRFDASSATILRTTLDAMARRGLYDHLGGGFFRYCVDAQWTIPHFEKMLYDNAQLIALYARGAARFAHAPYARAVDATVAWLKRDMLAAGGAFYSTLDADSEGEEGVFYLWQPEEVRSRLTPADFAVAERCFGLDAPPNFENHAWHLHDVEPAAEVARLLQRDVLEVEAARQRSREILLTARNQRVWPGLDDKILTAWNALLASGLLRAARALQRPEYADLAIGALDFLRRDVWQAPQLFACHAGDRAQFPAYLDDHAFLLDALIERLQWSWDDTALAWARALAEVLLERFEDSAQGGFHFTAHDHEALPLRPKPWTDDSLPSGNGVAARALLRLGHLLGETRYLDAAERTLKAGSTALNDMPQGCSSLLRALNDYLQPRPHLVVRAPEARLDAWRQAVDEIGNERIDAYFIDASIDLPASIPSTATPLEEAAWLCIGTRCLAPVNDPAALVHAAKTALA